jgi:hypothetical protein
VNVIYVCWCAKNIWTLPDLRRLYITILYCILVIGRSSQFLVAQASWLLSNQNVFFKKCLSFKLKISIIIAGNKTSCLIQFYIEINRCLSVSNLWGSGFKYRRRVRPSLTKDFRVLNRVPRIIAWILRTSGSATTVSVRTVHKPLFTANQRHNAWRLDSNMRDVFTEVNLRIPFLCDATLCRWVSEDEICCTWPFKMTAITFIRNVGINSTTQCHILEEWSYCLQVHIRQKYIIIFIRCEELELKDNSFLLSLYWAPQLSLDIAARVRLLSDKAIAGDTVILRLYIQYKTAVVMSMFATSDITFSQ